jgi:hypothetical protein
MNRFERFWMHPLGFASMALLLIAMLIGVIAFVDNYVTYVASVAQIEQLRVDLANTNIAESEDVVGQATEFNQQISTAQMWNDVLFVQLFIPNGWDAVQPLQVQRGP